jgi:hypothetical protein
VVVWVGANCFLLWSSNSALAPSATSIPGHGIVNRESPESAPRLSRPVRIGTALDDVSAPRRGFVRRWPPGVAASIATLCLSLRPARALRRLRRVLRLWRRS